MNILHKLTKEYKKSVIYFDQKNSYFLTTQKEFKEYFDEEDCNLLKVGSPFPTEVLEDIEFLEITYSKGRSWKILQQYLEQMTSLHTLFLPTIYMKDIHLLKFPKSLRSLRFINQSEFNNYFNENKEVFQNEKLLKDLKLENLTYLGIFHLSNCNRIEEYIQISPEQFPNLEYVEFRNDDKSTFLKQLQIFSNIKHLDISASTAPVFEYLAPFRNSLQTLSLIGLGEKFSFKGIGVLKSLQAIWINSTYCDTDCSAFLEVPQLEEIALINGKFVTNAESILELPNLVSLKILDCKTPDKKKLMTKELKKKFVERGVKSVW
jgi:hypothetical protein